MLERLNHQDYATRDLLVTPDQLLSKMQCYTEIRLADPMYQSLASKKSMNMKFINIADPTFSKNNLGKSISKLNSSRIQQGLKLQLKKMTRLYDEAGALGGEQLLKGLLSMFSITFECIGAHPVLSLILPQLTSTLRANRPEGSTLNAVSGCFTEFEQESFSNDFE
jgi:hypothetical protein